MINNYKLNFHSSANFVGDEGAMVLLYEPGSGREFTPIIQVTGGSREPVTVWIDRLDVVFQ